MQNRNPEHLPWTQKKKKTTSVKTRRKERQNIADVCAELNKELYTSTTKTRTRTRGQVRATPRHNEAVHAARTQRPHLRWSNTLPKTQKDTCCDCATKSSNPTHHPTELEIRRSKLYTRAGTQHITIELPTHLFDRHLLQTL